MSPGQAVAHLLTQIRDLIAHLAEPACEGTPASRQLTDGYRRQQREIVDTATEFAANLRARDQGRLFGRFDVLTALQEEIRTENASSLCRLASNLTEVLRILTESTFPVKVPSCVAEAVAGGAVEQPAAKRAQESLGALFVAQKRRRLPTPHHSAAGGSADEIEEEKSPKSDEFVPQPDGPPDVNDSTEGAIADADADVADYLDRCLSPDSDFSLSPR